MNHGSLYSGLGGLDWAVESALGCRTLWQLDQVNEKVRARHWPDSLQVVADVATVDPNELAGVDVLSGSFACQDLSVAGKGAGLIDGSRSGPTYRHLLRFAGARLTDEGFERDDRRKWLPEIVVMENVPALLSKWRAVLEEDWHRLGYTLTWVKARALDAGHPHLRARVFVVAQRGGCGGGVLDAPRDRMWTPEADARTWATVTAANPNEGEDPANWEARRLREFAKGINGNGMSEPLAQQVRTWATPKSSDARSPGESSGDGARQGSDGLACQVRPWPTPMAGSTAPNGHGGSNRLLPDAVRPWPTPQEADGLRGSANMFRGEGNPTLPGAVRPWPTVASRDAKSGSGIDRVGTPPLGYEAPQYPAHPFGSRLNADWAEALMGLPPGWTLPEGPRLHIDPKAPAVRGRYPADWDRSVYWPGFAWEPCRTIPDGPPCPGRPARIRAVGNAVDPQQGALAIRTAMQPRQGRLL